MPDMLGSKTIAGLLILLACIVGLAFAGHLDSNAVEALKWLGGTFFGVRMVANLPGNQPSA
jgi:hypothetical protein